jgi:hypothetical protein
MSWYRRFKNRKYCPPYDINGKDIEDLVQEYFDENELNYSRRWIDYRFDKAVLRVMRRTPYEFALDEIHTLFATLTPLPSYYIELDYIRQELKWFRDLIDDDNELVYTLDWLLDPTTRPIYFFLKYRSAYLNYIQTSNLFRKRSLVSLFPCDPDFGNVYYNNDDVTKVVAGSEKRGNIWQSGGFSKHRVFGHQWARSTSLPGHGAGFEPINHPRFKTRIRTKGKRYEI